MKTQITIEVTPSSEKAIVSGESGGTSSSKPFAVGVNNSDVLFTGSDTDWIENIGNIQIINFNANGGDLTINDIETTFNSLTIVNAQSTNDNVSIKFDDLTMIYGKTDSQIFELEPLSGGVNVNHFSIGTGNEKATNKWSIEGINVEVAFTILNDNYTTLNNEIFENDNDFTFLSVYPNPVSSENKINFKYNSTFVDNASITIEVYSLIGERIKSLQADANKGINTFEIETSTISSGIYFVNFYSTDGFTKSEKIIIN